MKAVYPGDGDGDGDPEAVPGRSPHSDSEPDPAAFTLEVDGEVFAVRPDGRGGTDYTWLSGPNHGYGFSLSPTATMWPDEHRKNIRAFLADIDPLTGYLTED